jgi:Flp pilus assembly protein TadG
VTRSTPCADRGQAAVELAVALPLVCLLVAGVLQVAVVARHQLAVQAAARNGARAAGAAASGARAPAAALATTSLRPLEVGAAEAGAMVTVTVTYVDPTDVPLIGTFLPAVTLRASVAMVVEPPGAPPGDPRGGR